MRVFIAINFSAETRSRLIALREELRSRSQHGNFSHDENLHLTLAFIGECDAKQTASAKLAMNTVRFEPFSAAIECVGRFKRDGGDIWWAGLREDKPLMNLQHEMEHKLALCGFEMGGRNYHPHITLGREVVTDSKPWQFEPFGEMVTSIELMKSERIGGKLTYTEIYKIQGSV